MCGALMSSAAATPVLDFSEPIREGGVGSGRRRCEDAKVLWSEPYSCDVTGDSVHSRSSASEIRLVRLGRDCTGKAHTTFVSKIRICEEQRTDFVTRKIVALRGYRLLDTDTDTELRRDNGRFGHVVDKAPSGLRFGRGLLIVRMKLS